MKKILFIAASLLAFVGCYDDSALWESVSDHESRISKLEKLCTEMNTNIVSLKTIVEALQKNDYVTDVTAVTEGGIEVGYTITFAKSGSITIYHGHDGADGKDGVDGADGKDGKDGTTPIVGVRQDTDGVYYWTLNGEWLLDESGNKIPATGKDGITPQLKIEDGYWYVSYDNGLSWTEAGKAVGDNGKDGEDGADGDSFFRSVSQDDVNVYLTLADGTVITVPKGLALSIEFAESDLVVMSANSTREIGYTVTSATETVKVEVTSSSDIKAKVVSDNESGLTGKIKISTGASIDEYSKVLVFVSNGDKVIMRSITFEEAGLVVEENATKQATAEGGEMILEFLSNVECEVVIPEDAKSWISVVPDTRAMEKQTITLKVEPNEGYYRSATVVVQSPDGTLKLEYLVEQYGELGVEIDPSQIPDNEIWYRTADNQIYDIYYSTNLYGHQPFDAQIVSHTYENGIGKIKCDNTITKINDSAFGNGWNHKLSELYLPETIEVIDTYGIRGNSYLTTLRIPKNLKMVGAGGLNNPNLESFSGSHITEDGRCVIIEDGFMPNYGDTQTPVKNYLVKCKK